MGLVGRSPFRELPERPNLCRAFLTPRIPNSSMSSYSLVPKISRRLALWQTRPAAQSPQRRQFKLAETMGLSVDERMKWLPSTLSLARVTPTSSRGWITSCWMERHVLFVEPLRTDANRRNRDDRGQQIGAFGAGSAQRSMHYKQSAPKPGRSAPNATVAPVRHKRQAARRG